MCIVYKTKFHDPCRALPRFPKPLNLKPSTYKSLTLNPLNLDV
jgi:hypothetical protein